MTRGENAPDLGDGWRVVRQARNPWGRVPLTGGGRSLPMRAQEYMDRLVAQVRAPDTRSRRHHYVPKAYLRQWSPDQRRIWSLDTVTGDVRLVGLSSVCAEEDFYRVVGADQSVHNRVELMFGVIDSELSRVQRLLAQLEDPSQLEFDDLVGLGLSMAVQRMRTAQQRRLRRQHDAWLVAQSPREFTSIENTAEEPHREAGIQTQALFEGMWEAADLFTTRQIEIWHDARGRFTTCDAPVFVPFQRNVRPDLLAAPFVLWPISPYRTIALSNNLQGEKAVIREATGKLVGMVREGVEQGRERMIFASEEQRDRLPTNRKFRRRAQSRLRCWIGRHKGNPSSRPNAVSNGVKASRQDRMWPFAIEDSTCQRRGCGCMPRLHDRRPGWRWMGLFTRFRSGLPPHSPPAAARLRIEQAVDRVPNSTCVHARSVRALTSHHLLEVGFPPIWPTAPCLIQQLRWEGHRSPGGGTPVGFVEAIHGVQH